MRTVVAVALGLLSGIFLSFITSMLITSMLAADSADASSAAITVALLGGWILSAYLLRRGARTVSKVFSRGALLGAAEWMVVAAVGVIVSGHSVAQSVTTSSPGAGMAGAVLGGGLAAFITGGIAVAMAIGCLCGLCDRPLYRP
jgi:hypothetical protein